MDDYQRWTRREVNRERAKPRPEYRFFPNRTPAQTFALSVVTAFAVMGLSSILMQIADVQQEKLLKRQIEDTRLIKTHIPMELVGAAHAQNSVKLNMWTRGNKEGQRSLLRLPAQPPASAMISDPELKYPEPRGQMTL